MNEIQRVLTRMAEVKAKSLFLTFLLLLTAVTSGAVTGVAGSDADPSAEEPIISMGTDQFEAKIDQYRFISPSYTVKDKAGHNITSRFISNYFIVGQENNILKDPDGKDYTQDPVTGTTVTRLYHNVKIGSKAGEVKIAIVVTPTSAYAGQYKSATKTYTITIGMQQPTLTTIPKDNMEMVVGQTVPAPTFKATYRDAEGFDHDIPADRYTLTAQVVSGDNHLSFSNANFATAGTTMKGLTTGNVTLRYTLTPKPEYATTFGSVSKEVTVGVNEFTKKIATHVEFSADDQEIYKYDPNAKPGNGHFQPLQAKIIDEYGNDITKVVDNQLVLQFVTPVKSNEQGHTPSDQSYQALDYGTLNIYGPTDAMHSGVSGVTYNVSASAKQTAWASPEVKNLYEEEGEKDSYVLHVLPRYLSSRLVPDPELTKVTKGYAVHFVTDQPRAFLVDGYFQDKFTKQDTILHYASNGNYKYYVGIPNEALSSNSIEVVGVKVDVPSTPGYTYYDIREKWGNENMHIIFNEAKDYDLKFVLNSWTPQQWDVSTENVTFHVVNTIHATMLIHPKEYTLYTDEPEGSSLRPSVKIVDDFGVDITEHYNLKYTVTSNTTGTSVTTDGYVTLGHTVGQTIVRVDGEPKDPLYEPTNGTYTINLIDKAGRFTYDILLKDSPDDKDMGKLVMTGAGRVAGSYEINGVPGLGVRFGAGTDVNWEVKEHGGRLVASSGPVRGREDNGLIGANTIGTFYTLKPITNGYLTIDANMIANNTIVLIGTDWDGKIVKETFTPNSDINGEHTFEYPLLAEQTYYLYNEGDGSSNNGLELYGLNYLPAYILSRSDLKPVTEATMFMGSYQGSLPKLVAAEHRKHSFTSSDINVATVGERSGEVTPVKTASAAVTITGKVESYEKAGVYRNAKYLLHVSDIPTYVVEDASVFGVGDRLTTTNHETDITMTMGGWIDGAGPYIKKDAEGNPTGENLIDSWKTAKEDLIKNSLDGFVYQSQGGQNATDEFGLPYSESGSTSKPGNLPARGTYLRFEPRESGTLMVYVLQNGACDYDEDVTDNGHNAKNREIKWRPLFITDETGKSVAPDDEWNISGVKDIQANPNYKTKGSYTENHFRASIDDAFIAANGGWNFDNFKGTEHDKQKLKDAWTGKTSSDVMQVVRLDNGGYTTISKAYVRYAIHVKAGKTYFVFQKGSKLGFCGFAFVPEGWSADRGESRVKGTPVTLDDDVDYQAPGEVENVQVTLKRAFKSGHWTTICLPFSVQETEFKKIFGEDAIVATFDKIVPGGEEGGTLYFRQHVYHMIEAGVPYFLKPAADLSEVVFPNASFESSVDPTFFYSKEQGGFKCKGIYNTTTIAPFSYILNGTLSRRVEASKRVLKGYRSYLENVIGAAGDLGMAQHAKIAFFRDFSDMEETTGIDDVMLAGDESMAASAAKGVFDLQGRKVAGSASELFRLPKGVYIVNGKKMVIN